MGCDTVSLPPRPLRCLQFSQLWDNSFNIRFLSLLLPLPHLHHSRLGPPTRNPQKPPGGRPPHRAPLPSLFRLNSLSLRRWKQQGLHRCHSGRHMVRKRRARISLQYQPATRPPHRGLMSARRRDTLVVGTRHYSKRLHLGRPMLSSTLH